MLAAGGDTRGVTGIWDLFAWFAAAEPRPERGDTLVKCRICRAEAVVPIAWEDGGDNWRIALRCGECGNRRDVTLDDAEAGEFDRALDRGIHEIARTVRVLERRRLLGEIETLSIALERDLIGADDFAPGRPAR